MIYIVGLIIFVLSFLSLYCSAVMPVLWFKLTICTMVSLALAVVVTANLYY